MKSFFSVARVVLPCVLLLHCWSTTCNAYTTEDIFVPEQCDSIAKAGDHLLIEYSVTLANGTSGASLKAPDQLYHVLVDASDELPVMSALKGMCKNATRHITWDVPSEVNMQPIFLKSDKEVNSVNQGLTVAIHVVHITEPDDYAIFDHLRANNIPVVLDMIEEHKGVNAVDEWGQTPLMIAVQMQNLETVAALLNTRLPRVDINMAKSVSTKVAVLINCPVNNYSQSKLPF